MSGRWGGTGLGGRLQRRRWHRLGAGGHPRRRGGGRRRDRADGTVGRRPVRRWHREAERCAASRMEPELNPPELVEDSVGVVAEEEGGKEVLVRRSAQLDRRVDQVGHHATYRRELSEREDDRGLHAEELRVEAHVLGVYVPVPSGRVLSCAPSRAPGRGPRGVLITHAPVEEDTALDGAREVLDELLAGGKTEGALDRLLRVRLHHRELRLVHPSRRRRRARRCPAAASVARFYLVFLPRKV